MRVDITHSPGLLSPCQASITTRLGIIFPRAIQDPFLINNSTNIKWQIKLLFNNKDPRVIPERNQAVPSNPRVPHKLWANNPDSNNLVNKRIKPVPLLVHLVN